MRRGWWGLAALSAPMCFDHGPSREYWVARGGAARGALGIVVVHGLEKPAKWRVPKFIHVQVLCLELLIHSKDSLGLA
jgi:hypothetical protein